MNRFRPIGSFRSYDPLCDLKLVRGDGCYVWDEHGNKYADFVCGFSSLNLGHHHPRLMQVAHEQLDLLTFSSVGQSTTRNELEKEVALFVESSEQNHATRFTADSLGIHAFNKKKVWLASTGARAVEIAWKLACLRKPGKLVRFDRAYHGRSIATSLISDTRHVEVLGVDLADEMSYLIPFPNCHAWAALPMERPSFPSAMCSACKDALSEATKRLTQVYDRSSALIVEPVIGSRGYYFACPEYFRSLTSFARNHGLSVISDEIQMGLGRLGEMIVSHVDGWFPDFLVFGKSLGGGIVPLSAVVGNADDMDRMQIGLESETFAGSPFACRIALETFGVLGSDEFMCDVRKRGTLFRETLAATKIIPKDAIEGRGLLTVLDWKIGLLSANLNANENAGAYAEAFVRDLRRVGLLVHLTGLRRDRIALMPPLIIDERSMNQAAMLIQESWERVVSRRMS